MLQRQLLLLRSSHGSFVQQDMYNPLTDIAMLLGYDVVHILSAIESSKSLQKAIHDYEQNGGYNYGTTLKGKQMKRRTSQKDLMELISYDSVVGSVVGLQTGNRPRLTESEKPYFRRWIEDLDKTYKRNTEEEDEVYYDGWGYAHSLAEERRKRKENPNVEMMMVYLYWVMMVRSQRLNYLKQ